MKRVEPITQAEFRAEVKRLRRVVLGLDKSEASLREYALLLRRNEERKLRERPCKCGCGQFLSRTQVLRGTRFLTNHHAMHWRFRRRLRA